MSNKNKAFATWLLGKIHAMEQEERQRISATDFAKKIGVPQNLMSRWLQGKGSPGDKYVSRIAAALGCEVYAVIEMDKPAEGLQFIIELWGRLSQQKQQDIVSYAEKVQGS